LNSALYRFLCIAHLRYHHPTYRKCPEYRGDANAVTFTVQAAPLPPLTFSGPTTINNGSSASFTVNRTGPTNPPAISITVTPNNAGVSLGAGAGMPITIPMNAGVLLAPFTVTAAAVGQTQLTGTATGYANANQTISVPAPGLTLNLAPNTLVIERGSSGITSATIARTGGFAGTVTITPSPPPALPTGVTVAPATIAAGLTTGPVTFAVDAAAQIKTTPGLRVGAAGPNMTPTAPAASVTLIVPPATGPFIEASPAPYTNGAANSTVNSLTGTFSVDINTGAAAAVPQPRSARFRKSTTPVGSAVGFTVGPTSNLGGAGFCVDNGAKPARTRGVVMSGAPVASNAQYSFTLIDLMGTPSVIRQMDADGSKSSPALVAQPRIYFSPDCTLALVKGVNILGPSNYSLTVNSMETGNPLSGSCGSPIQFNTYTSPTAVVQRTGTQTSVMVTVDAGTPSAQTCTYTVP
jgi:hypothetical protein